MTIKKIIYLFVLLLLCHQLPAQEKKPLAIMQAKTYHNQSVKGWLLSEKLDGVRGYWDGKNMWSKNSNLFTPEGDFLQGFPDFALDGELYSGRGQFAKISSMVRSGHWQGLKYHVFDVPAAKGGLQQRLDVLRQWLAKHPNPRIVIIKQIVIDSIKEAHFLRKRIEKLGGEGVMLRNPDSPYLAKRTDNLLKLKSFQDAECIVKKHLPGKGKYRGKLGAILCQLEDGKTIKIGTGFSDKQRENPPALGLQITYRYNGLTKNGKPRFVRFWRIRPRE